MIIQCSLVDGTDYSIVYGFKLVYIRTSVTKICKIADVKGSTLNLELARFGTNYSTDRLQCAFDTYDQAYVQWQEAIEDYTAYLEKGR
jgi:hypothetical protein